MDLRRCNSSEAITIFEKYTRTGIHRNKNVWILGTRSDWLACSEHLLASQSQHVHHILVSMLFEVMNLFRPEYKFMYLKLRWCKEKFD